MSIDIAERFEAEDQFDKAYEEYKKALEKRPKSIELLERTAHLATVLGKLEDAEMFYSRILEHDATNTLAYEQLMDIYINTNKYKYYICRGNLHVCQEQTSHAINDFKKAIEKTHEDDELLSARFVLAGLYEKTNKISLAIDEYLKILDLEAVSETSYIKLANLYESQDSLSSAINILERAEEKGIESNTIKELLASYYLKNNQPDVASKISKDKLIQIQCLLDEEKFDDAKNIIEEIRSDYKKNPKYLSLVAQYYYHIQDFEKALESVDEFAKFDKKSPLIYQMRALIYESKKDGYNEHLNWAKYNIERGNDDVALNEYLFALQYNDKNAELISTIANLLDSMNEKTHAIEYYEKLVHLEPNNKKALERLADFRVSVNDYKMAIEYFEKLYCLDNRNSRILKELAKAYEKTKDFGKAVEFYNKYLSSSSVGNDYEQIKKKIEKLEGKKKEYAEATDDDGLIGKIMRLFSRQ